MTLIVILRKYLKYYAIDFISNSSLLTVTDSSWLKFSPFHFASPIKTIALIPSVRDKSGWNPAMSVLWD